MITPGDFENLSVDDDPLLWETALARVISDAEILSRSKRSRRPIFARIGRCSHWLSPHNNGSWFKDVEKFAWPSGYGHNGSLIFGLPEFDWSIVWKWNEDNADWELVPKVPGQRHLLFRVAIPARTARHVRAVVHTVWTPGSPTIPKEEFLQGYAFKKVAGIWKFVAVSGREDPYKMAEPIDSSEIGSKLNPPAVLAEHLYGL